MRGLVSGLIWGLVFATGGVGVLSLLTPIGPAPDRESQVAETKTVPAEPADAGAAQTDTSDTATADTDTATPETPKTVTAETETAQADPANSETAATETPAADTTHTNADETPVASAEPTEAQPEPAPAAEQVAAAPVTVPDIDGVATDLEQPSETPVTPGIDVAREQPATPTSPAPAPAVPNTSVAAPAPAEGAVQPVAPIVADAGAGIGAAPTVGGVSPDVDSQTEPAPTASAPVAKGVEPAAEAVPDPSTAPAPAPKVVTEITPAPAPLSEDSIDIAPIAEIEPIPESAPQPDVASEPEAHPESNTSPAPAVSEAPQIATLPQAGTESAELRPTIGRRVVPLTERGRATSQDVSASASASGSAVSVDETPLKRFAGTYSNPENKPEMAIVLIDDDRSLGVEALQDFPYPLTFAINPTAPDAVEKMARHRAAGFEVLVLVDLPVQAKAQDAEVALAASFETLNQAVGILEGTGTGIQGNRKLSDQVTAFVAATGRGMITQNNGLNTVHKLATRNGVPAAVVFRDFDGAGQTPVIMRRFLDQAAFRAGRDGGVVMMGRIRPDTISALLLWGLQDRASRVVLVPASAVLSQ